MMAVDGHYYDPGMRRGITAEQDYRSLEVYNFISLPLPKVMALSVIYLVFWSVKV